MRRGTSVRRGTMCEDEGQEGQCVRRGTRGTM